MKSTPPRKRDGQMTGPRQFSGEILDVGGVATLLGTSEKCIRSRVARHLLPYRKLAGRVVSLRADVLAFLKKLDGVSVDQAIVKGGTRAGGR